MHEENKTKNRAAIALALCFCVLALTSFLAVKSSLNKISNSGTTVADNNAAVTKDQEAAVKTPVVDSQDNATQVQDNSKPAQPAPDYIAPIDGSIILKYSMNSLVYSKTLDQYMTHPGVDISAELSSEVSAIADGTVSKVYNDDRYGTTVCIVHDNELTSIYSNLSEHGLIETGDEVKQGQVIGCIGDSALFESLDESHLHFEIQKNGEPVDPGEYIERFKQQ